MKKEFIIGREGNQPFPIPHKGLSSSSDSVHRQHAKIIVDDYGNWILEDIKGSDGNGTFIRNDKGIFERVYKTRISEDTVIRLGNEGQHSFTFMAHHVLVTNPDDYSYEFRKTKEYLDLITAESANIQDRMNFQSLLAKYVLPVAGLCLSLIPMAFKFDNWIITRICFLVPPFLIGPFLNKSNSLKEVKDKAERVLVCPKCQRPISKYDIKNQLCPTCKAH